MINAIKSDAETRMKKSLEALGTAFNKIRTGRAHPSILEGIHVNYYGVDTPLQQLANINVEDSRTLSITPWERTAVQAIEKAIMTSDLGLNPCTAGTVIRIPMPALTEETRKNFIKHAKAEAEVARVSLRNIRRDANGQLKDLLKDKDISEDDERRAQDDVQKITDKYVAEVDKTFSSKEQALMEI